MNSEILRTVARLAALTGLVAGGAVTALPALAATAAKPAAGPPRMERVQARPAVPAGARAIGAVARSASVTGEVVLKPRDSAALARFIAEVTDPNSAMFHRYLPAGAFAGRFGPTRSQLGAVRSLLTAHGLRVRSVARDGLIVHFTGTASAAESAFHTGLESYRLADGTRGQSTTSAITLPSTVAGSVNAVLGLDSLVRIEPIGVRRAPASARGKIKAPVKAAFTHPKGAPSACAPATTAANIFGGLTDDQIAHAYGAFGLYSAGDFGAGQSIALYELEPFARSDMKAFDTCYFGAAAATKMLSRLHVIKVDGGQPAGPGSGEANLDVEDIAGLAPGASIDVYEGTSPGSNGVIYDPVDPYAAMINTDRDQIISTSWGLCEQAVQQGQPGLQQAENALFQQAAAQGQSIFSASGDNGSDDCNTFETSTPVSGQNPLSVDDPSSQPYVVAVGGTTIDDASTPPVEQVWNDGPAEGADGGGISESWTMPAWQRQATVPGITRPGSALYKRANKVETKFGFPQNFCESTVPGASSPAPCRLLPDVSAQADQFTGAITTFEAAFGGWSTVGGTSSSTPVWAALLALINASPDCQGNPATAHGVGFVNPLLYAVASVPAQYGRSFNDVAIGNNDVYGIGSGGAVFPASKGYDLATGLGSPDLVGKGGTDGLAFFLCEAGRQALRPAVTSITPAFGSTAGGETITIHGSRFDVAHRPDVTVLQIGGAQLKPGDFHVVNATTITATVPPASEAFPPTAPAPQDGAGPATVIVTTNVDATSKPVPGSVFQYVDEQAGNAVPSVTGVVPVGGSESAPGRTTILGSGFTGATSVRFGGVPAASFTVVNSNVITATPPAFSAHPHCAPLPTTGVYAGMNASNDICQVEVRVANSHGASATASILPPDEGAVTINNLGVLVPPSGCGCEIQQAPDEYDYAPKPTITSVSTSGAANLASEQGGTVITVHGTGLDPLTIDWADFGDPALAASVVTDFVFMTGTEMQVVAPGEPVHPDVLRLPFSVRSLAGQSSARTVTYAGVPVITSVTTVVHSRKLDGVPGAADSGGSAITIAGSGFAGQLIAPVEFTSANFSLGTQYIFTVSSNVVVKTTTVSQNPALTDVRLCTVSGCSKAGKNDRLLLYPPGTAHVGSVRPASGPAAGGTKVTVSGANLGCPVAVFFGTAKATFSPVQALLDCNSTTMVHAVSPKGKAGTKVPVTVETAQSFYTGSGHGTTAAKFTYKK